MKRLALILSSAIIVAALLALLLPLKLKTATAEEVEMHKSNGIDFVDANGVARINISADSPDPQVNGKRYKRDVPFAGLTLRDSKGNETGGVGMLGDGQTRAMALDYTTREAIFLWADDDSTNPSAGLVVNEKLKPAEDMPGRSRRRITLQVENDLPTLTFLGKDGKPRIVIGLDSLDNPIIQITTKDGKTRNLAE